MSRKTDPRASERPPAAPGGTRRVTITHLGRRGEGVVETPTGRLYVPYALAGEVATVAPDGDRATLLGLLEESPDRIAPFCPYFGTCGGCAIQHLAPEPYRVWKRDLLVSALARAGLRPEVAPLVDAHGEGRRRATFHSRVERDGRVAVGFMKARAHEIVAIEACPILDPRLAGALPAARAIAKTLAVTGKPLDIVVLATESGLDVDLRGLGPLDEGARARLIAVAAAHDLARLSNHGIPVIARRMPLLRIGHASVEPPPGVFQQATQRGEAILAELVGAGAGGARRIADLFAGVGTFALRLAAAAEVAAIDSEAAALAALDVAARRTADLRPIRVETRDLFNRPLTPGELEAFDLVVLDPPRAGAEAQMRNIGESKLSRVIAVGCDAQSFARDAAILVAAGFTLERTVPVDQFRHSPHLEIVAQLHRAPKKPKRRLLG